MKTLPAGTTSEGLHYWDAMNPFSKNPVMLDLQFINWQSLVKHPLLCFDSVDSMINWLYINDFKDSAREINKKVKEQ